MSTRASAAAEVPEVRAATRAAWRAWLKAHHATAGTIWLVYPKKDTPLPPRTTRLDYDALVEEALCFGWIDSVPKKRDDGWAMIRVSPRKPRSVWSALNKRRIAMLIEAGRMAPAGLAAVDAAKANGAWAALEESDTLQVPDDLARALAKNRAAARHFAAFPAGVRKNILQWISTAKREETRAQRIQTTVAMAAENLRANHPRQPKGGA